MSILDRFLCGKRHASYSVAVWLLLAMVVWMPTAADAEYLGLTPAREAMVAKSPALSVELGFVSGELADVDYQNIAARVNYRLSDELLLTGTIGSSEFASFDGIPFGLGLVYHLSNQRISDKVEIAGKAGYHFGDFSFLDTDGDVTSLSLELLVSGAQPLMQNGLAWYTNFGYHRLSTDFANSDSSNEIGYGAGLVLPASFGEAYAGFELIDDLTFGIGVRYFVQ